GMVPLPRNAIQNLRVEPGFVRHLALAWLEILAGTTQSCQQNLSGKQRLGVSPRCRLEGLGIGIDVEQANIRQVVWMAKLIVKLAAKLFQDPKPARTQAEDRGGRQKPGANRGRRRMNSRGGLAPSRAGGNPPGLRPRSPLSTDFGGRGNRVPGGVVFSISSRLGF